MSNIHIEWTDLAIQDLYLITQYIAKDSIKNSNSVYKNIFSAVEDLGKFPKKGRKIPEIEEDYYREIFVTSYRIMYKIDENTIYIVAVFHMAQNFEKLELTNRN